MTVAMRTSMMDITKRLLLQGNNLIIWRRTLLQDRCVKSPNKDGSHAKNVDVKLDAKAQRTRKTCCIPKTSNNKELVRRKSHGTSKREKKKKT